jgi:hypothetical protein
LERESADYEFRSSTLLLLFFALVSFRHIHCCLPVLPLPALMSVVGFRVGFGLVAPSSISLRVGVHKGEFVPSPFLHLSAFKCMVSVKRVCLAIQISFTIHTRTLIGKSIRQNLNSVTNFTSKRQQHIIDTLLSRRARLTDCLLVTHVLPNLPFVLILQ